MFLLSFGATRRLIGLLRFVPMTCSPSHCLQFAPTRPRDSVRSVSSSVSLVCIFPPTHHVPLSVPLSRPHTALLTHGESAPSAPRTAPGVSDPLPPPQTPPRTPPSPAAAPRPPAPAAAAAACVLLRFGDAVKESKRTTNPRTIRSVLLLFPFRHAFQNQKAIQIHSLV